MRKRKSHTEDKQGVPKDFFYNTESHNLSINDTAINQTQDELNATKADEQPSFSEEEEP